MIKEKIELYKRSDNQSDLNSIETVNEKLLNTYLNKVFDLEVMKNSLNMLEKGVFSTYEKYSEQERNALLSQENFILLGRSGTGKTMVALTKIFLLRMCSNLKETKFLLDGYKYSIRIIFCTTSPRLIEEVRNYYLMMEKKFMEKINICYEPLEKFNSHVFDQIEVE